MSLTKIFDINPKLRQSLIEAVSGETLDLTRSDTAWHWDPQNVLTSYAADTPAFGPKGLWSVGSYRQECLDSEDPGEWLNSSATVIDTGETLNNFKKYTVTDNGATSHRINFFDSDASNNPATRTFFVVYYDAGTSNKIRVYGYDADAVLGADYRGNIGSAEVNLTDAGVITIISDGPDDYYNCRSVCGYIDWTNPSNRVLLGIGPSSNDNSNIIVYGADSFNDITYRLPHVPSSGSTVSIATQAADGAGNGLAPALSSLDSRVEAAMDSTFSVLFHIIPKFASTALLAGSNIIWEAGDTANVGDNITESPDGTFTVTAGGTGNDNRVVFNVSASAGVLAEMTLNCTVGGGLQVYNGTTYINMGTIDTGVQTFRAYVYGSGSIAIRLLTNNMVIEDVTITKAALLLSSGDFNLSICSTCFAITDGTNTATVAHGGFDAEDELWLFGQANASTSKLRAGIIGESSITWGDEADYTGGMNPGTNLLVFKDNEEYAQIGGVWMYEGVASADGQIIAARDAVKNQGRYVKSDLIKLSSPSMDYVTLSNVSF